MHMKKVVPTAAGGMVWLCMCWTGRVVSGFCACLGMRSVGTCIGLAASALRVFCESRLVCGAVVVCLVEVYSSCCISNPPSKLCRNSRRAGEHRNVTRWHTYVWSSRLTYRTHPMVQAWPITGAAAWARGLCVGLTTAWQGSSRVSYWVCPGMQRIAHTAVRWCGRAITKRRVDERIVHCCVVVSTGEPNGALSGPIGWLSGL